MTVFESWSKVMADVQAIGKAERVESGPSRFHFRGIDTVMNAVGPSLREHGVAVVPTAEHIEVERYQTAKGAVMQGAIVRVVYTVHGPDGDSFQGASYGQAADAGDKAVSKAMSVAYRTFLLQSLTIPTDEPDPDREVHERADERPVAAPPDPVVVAKVKLNTALQSQGIELDAFMAWALSEAGPGVDIRSADVETLEGLTRRVVAEGKAILGGESDA